MDRLAGIQLFIRVVETGSFSRAAADLNITQPTVTKQIAALERHLGARLLNRNTRGVSPTEIGALYYERCKAIQREIEEADSLAALFQSRITGQIKVSASMAFGRRVVTPLVLRFMERHPEVSIDLQFDDRYVNLVEQGVDVAIRLGRLSDSSLGARYLGLNPWLMVASPEYLGRAGEPRGPQDLAGHRCLIYGPVASDEVWRLTDAHGREVATPIGGRLRSNNLSAVLAGAQAHLGLAILPCFVARDALASGSVHEVLAGYRLPAQEIHAVYPSPRLISAKVSALIAFLQDRFVDNWWRDGEWKADSGE